MKSGAFIDSPAMAVVVRGTAAGLSFLVGLVTARLLGVETFGSLNVLLALVNVGVVLSLLGHENLATRTIAVGIEKRDLRATASYRSKSSRQIWIAGGLVALSFAAVQRYWQPARLSLVELLSFAVLVPLIARTRLGQAMVRGMHKSSLALIPDGIFRPTLMIFGVVLAALVGQTTLANVGFAFATAAVGGVVLVYAFEKELPVPPRGVPPQNGQVLPSGFSAPLYASSLLSVITTQLAVIVVGYVAGSASAGIYSAAEKIALAASLISQSVYLAISSRLATIHSTGNRQLLRLTLRKYTRVIGGSTLILCIGLAWFGAELLSLFGAAFSEGATTLRILLCCTLVTAVVGPIGQLLMMTHHESAHARSMVVSLAVQVALYIWLIPILGALGVAISALMATLVWNGLMMVEVRRKLGIRGILAWA